MSSPVLEISGFLVLLGMSKPISDPTQLRLKQRIHICNCNFNVFGEKKNSLKKFGHGMARSLLRYLLPRFHALSGVFIRTHLFMVCS